ncbi:putative secreted lipase [Lachnellula suecica]|uniref:Carboxylic ester hydrolase n=1 Tax=Lachnellula suecica TaxID=602035 RepID=A0A8T9C0R2_9HELO|nr:putative secreted lipase [Lachnellula suecica]
MYLLVLIILVLSSLVAATPHLLLENRADLSTIVDLDYAKYQGQNLPVGIKQWLGMRFAAPPLGDLRFRAPVDPVPVTGVQDASQLGAICLAVGATASSTENEDCLFVNVYAPSNATAQSRLPVWFFIQGGGYSFDGDANYNATQLIKRSSGNFVLVEFNYRVGPFGFLASEKIRKNGDLNAGFLDQRKALEWTQKYVSKFGGDPKHVVIHGDSAGAGSVVLHLAAYGGQDDHLFIGGIGESVFFPTQRKVPELEFQFDQFANASGCLDALDQLSCLRETELATLAKANLAYPYPGQTQAPLWPYSPCVDGVIIQDFPSRLYGQGKFVKVPLMIGDDTDEGTGFVFNASTPQEFSAFMKVQYPGMTSSELLAMLALYPKMAPFPQHAAYFPSLAAAYGEATLTCPGLHISESMAIHYDPRKVWNYRYNVLDAETVESGYGVPHVAETPAIWGVGPSGSGKGNGTSYDTYNAAVIPVVMDYWINFVRYLNPNGIDQGSNLPDWEMFQQGMLQRRVVIETNNTRMETIPADQRVRCQFWEGITPNTEI